MNGLWRRCRRRRQTKEQTENKVLWINQKIKMDSLVQAVFKSTSLSEMLYSSC